MAAFRIAPPTSFVLTQPEGWEAWLKRFNRFTAVSGIDTSNIEVMISTLVYGMGIQAEDILSTFALSSADRKKHEKVREQFDAYFVKRCNTTYERAKFNQRKQGESESVDSFSPTGFQPVTVVLTWMIVDTTCLLVKLVVDRPALLESFATLSGHLNMLLRQIKHDKTPPLQNSVVLPITLSQQRDDELERLTEGRVPVLHHEIVPDYLRTKLDLELESQEQELEVEVSKLSPEMAQEQVASLNDKVRQILQLVNEYKENWEERT